MNREKNGTPRTEGVDSAPRHTGVRTGVPVGGERKPRKEHHRRWLFLVMDVLLLLGIVAVVLYLVSLLTPFSLFDADGEEMRRITYTVELAGVSQEVFASLKPGDTVIDAESGTVLGTVEGVVQRAYSTYTDIPTPEKDAVLDSHVVTKATYPDSLNTVTVTVVTEASYTAGVGYAVDDCRIAIGRTYTVRFPGCVGDAVCIAMNAQ